MQLRKTGLLALSLAAIASITGDWLVINSRAISNQTQTPNAERNDAGKMPGIMQHGGMNHGGEAGGMPGMMQHDSGMMNHSMAMV